MENFHVMILAAGKGERMKSEKPKPLIKYQGQPLLSSILKAVGASGVCSRPTIVINPEQHQLFQQTISGNYHYVFQKEQLGTGHAVMSARETLVARAENIIVLYGDHPLVTASTIRKLAQIHFQTRAILTLMTIKVSDFQDWRQAFNLYGRIIRDEQGQLEKIIEFKDCDEAQKQILEVNPAYYCFYATWLWENLKLLKNDNQQGEYYLTDMVELAIEQNQKVVDIPLDNPKEGLGVNSVEELNNLQQLNS